MAAQIWENYVPATSGAPIPLDYHQLLQEAIPVHKALIVTASGGTAVSLPTAFTAVLSAATQYGVSLTKQTFDAGGGELYISNKTTASFKVQNSGSVYGESVLVVVYWLPA